MGEITSSELTVRGTEQALPNTLSHRYGAGMFPHHTDYAFRPHPPRAIILVNKTSEAFTRPTYFTRLEDIGEPYTGTLRNSFWTLQLKEGHFIVGGVFSAGSKQGYRWDQDFLSPENSDAWRCRKEVPDALVSHQRKHEWLPQTALLIDNWRCTHSRGALPEGDDAGQRSLQRYEVWQHAGLDE